eukprot:snap_masked-scaffold_14-processed-gene-5.16-mRNA-1 protein AED:0.75 eAED:0.75 QI:0/-1/0/1/-1/1/1/0/381
MQKNKVKQSFQNEATFSGFLIAGKREGAGKQEMAGEFEYYGQFQKNFRHGYGVQRWEEGENEPRKFEKYGCLNDLKRKEYKGDFVTGRVEGKGVMEFAGGWKYKGEFKSGLAEGFGKFIFLNGVYEGEFKRGFFHGKGILTYKVQRRKIQVKGKFTFGLPPRNALTSSFLNSKRGIQTSENKGEKIRMVILSCAPESESFYFGELKGGKHRTGFGIYIRKRRFETFEIIRLSKVEKRKQEILPFHFEVYFGNFVDGKLNGSGLIFGGLKEKEIEVILNGQIYQTAEFQPRCFDCLRVNSLVGHGKVHFARIDKSKHNWSNLGPISRFFLQKKEIKQVEWHFHKYFRVQLNQVLDDCFCAGVCWVFGSWKDNKLVKFFNSSC